MGCGPGGIAIAIADGGAQVHAIDRDQYDSPLPAARSYAVRHGIRVGFARADAAALPYADERFACVVCSSVIEHLDDPAASLREMRRVLQRGGIALVDFPLFHGPYGGHIDDVVRAPWFHLRPRAQVEARLERAGAARELALYRSLNRITLRAFRGMVRAAGFEVAEFRRMYYLTHPGRKLLAGLAQALRARSARAAAAALLAARRDFTPADAVVFPLLVGLVPLSIVPGLDEYATTGVRFVLRRPR